MLGLKIFLGVMIALMLLGIIGARTKCSKFVDMINSIAEEEYEKVLKEKLGG